MSTFMPAPSVNKRPVINRLPSFCWRFAESRGGRSLENLSWELENTAVDSIDERYTLDREITQDRVIQLTRTKN